MPRALLMVLDSVGIGGAPDAAAYHDDGANTLGHVAQWRTARGAPLALPNLAALGLWRALAEAGGSDASARDVATTGAWAVGISGTKGKDTTSGHWEMTCAPPAFDFGYFPVEAPSIPAAITDAMVQRGGLSGILGNCHASGTTIIAELGREHVATGKPIVYTSGDSVVQIAAHEDHFGVERLYDLCRITRDIVDPFKIARVIARPFVGEEGAFKRTAKRRDVSMPSPDPTLLDDLRRYGRDVVGIGKIGDIFAHRGMNTTLKAHGIASTTQVAAAAFERLSDGGLVFANVVEFDSDFGHRRDIAGYADALEEFDRLLPSVLATLREGDLLAITADHGNDPSWRGSDHTREAVPILFYGPGIGGGALGQRSMADIGATIARHLAIDRSGTGHAIDLPAR